MGAPRWWEPPAAPSSSVVSQKAGRSLENETRMPVKHENNAVDSFIKRLIENYVQIESNNYQEFLTSHCDTSMMN